MEIIIYGKDGCVNCERARMLCQIQSLAHQLLKLDADYSAEALQARVGRPVRGLPQIFVRSGEDAHHVGGYDELRAYLRQSQAQAA
ncbi:hypothetical protein GCM10022279_20030 [Comamonas faecalis]|uniref:Glutaredoxin domain-containing protein n=1 Tax=Comamonas faecalis TaxID=1387849 RepID=A0ABP7REN2_9BURK